MASNQIAKSALSSASQAKHHHLEDIEVNFMHCMRLKLSLARYVCVHVVETTGFFSSPFQEICEKIHVVQ